MTEYKYIYIYKYVRLFCLVVTPDSPKQPRHVFGNLSNVPFEFVASFFGLFPISFHIYIYILCVYVYICVYISYIHIYILRNTE